MSLTSAYLESQPEFEQQTDVLLETAIKDIQRATRTVERIENLSEITFGDLETISRNLRLALMTLKLAIGREEHSYFDEINMLSSEC